jgi:molecular chaperone GrpE
MTETNIDPSVEQKTSELAILKQSLDESKAESAALKGEVLRARADFENYRKRMEKEKSDARRWGREEVVGKLLSLSDVLEQAESAAQKGADLKSIVIGLDMLYKEFKRLLKEEGLEEVAAEPGLPFDPAVHEAVETVPHDGDENRVLSALQRGYRLNGNLLRPARVKVSCKHSHDESAKKEER